MARCFVAIWPDEAIVSALRGLPTPPFDGVRWVPPEDWHITLRFVGDADVDAVVDALADGLAGVRLPATEITLGPAVTRLGERTLVVPAAGADELSRLVDERTAAFGTARRKPFVGHLTLARQRSPEDLDLLGQSFNARFSVREIVVATSEPKSDGAHYAHAAVLPLPTS